MKDKSNIFAYTMQNGGIIGIALSAVLLFFYFTDGFFTPWMLNTQCIVLAALLFRFNAKYRDAFLNEKLPYFKGVYFALLMSFFASIILALTAYILFSIDAELLSQFRANKAAAIQANQNIDEVFRAMQVKKAMNSTPTSIAVGEIFIFTIVGLLISLILGLFLKKKKFVLFPTNKPEL